VSSWEDVIIVLVSGATAWTSLCDFSGRSRWAASQYQKLSSSDEFIGENTTIFCNMGCGEGLLLSVEELDPPNYVHMSGLGDSGVFRGVKLHFTFKVVDILDGARVEVFVELDEHNHTDGPVLSIVREWASDQLNTIKRRAELAPRTEQEHG